MNIKPINKKCDKCKKRNTQKRIIKRVCFQIHFPYYDYAGFDLCEDCLKKLERNLGRWFK